MNIFQKNARKFIVLASLAGSASAIFIRLIDTSPEAMGFYRLGFAMLIFTPPIIFGGYKGYRGFSVKDILSCVLAGFFLFGHFFCWFTAVKNTAIASAAVLISVHPLVIVFITTVFLKYRVKAKSLLGIITVLTGGAIIAGFDYSYAGDQTFGNAVALVAAVFFGGYFLVGHKMRAKMQLMNYVFIVFGSCFLFFSATMLVTKTPFTGYRAEDYLWIIAMTLVCQVIAHVLYNWSMKYASSLYVSVCVSFEAVFATALGIIFLQEIPTVWQCVGGAIAISGLIYYNLNEVRA